MSLPNLGALALAPAPPKGLALDDGEETENWWGVVGELDKRRLPEDIQRHIIEEHLQEAIPYVNVEFEYGYVGREQATQHDATAWLYDTNSKKTESEGPIAALRIRKTLDYDPYPSDDFWDYTGVVPIVETMTRAERDSFLEAQYNKPLEVRLMIDKESKAAKALLALQGGATRVKPRDPRSLDADGRPDGPVEYIWSGARGPAFAVTTNMRLSYRGGQKTVYWVEFDYPVPGFRGWGLMERKLLRMLCTACPLIFGTSLKALKTQAQMRGKRWAPLPWYTGQLDALWGQYENTMRWLGKSELLDRMPEEPRTVHNDYY